MSDSPPSISYADWNPPSAPFPIRYSLTLFREIDFFVADGYRRIPHGGLEVGAVLYGQGGPSGLTIQAYGPIECQHSFGPSFTLSPFDLEQLDKQVAKPLTTEMGEELEVVGWLISNCRSDLVLTDQEGQVYDEYFPGPRQVTLLAKPEKFKSTRYVFLARPQNGGLAERVCSESFILPLSTKVDATGVRDVPATSSLPHRETSSALAQTVSEPELTETKVGGLSTPQPLATTGSIESTGPEPSMPDLRIEPSSTNATDPRAILGNVARFEQAGPAEQSPESLYPRSHGSSTLTAESGVTQGQPDESIEEIPEARRARKASPWEIGLAAAILAMLTAAATWTYLHLPALPIPLDAALQPGQVVVTWAPELTKNAGRCFIVSWINGQPTSQTLSGEEQSRGKAIIRTDSSDVTIQLRAEQWYRDQIGQIRVFRVIPAPH